MSHSPADNELIERYLLGKLSDKEMRDFKLRLEDDREFARKFRMIKMFPEMMSDAGRKEFEKIQAEAREKESMSKSLTAKKRKYIIWGIAGLVIIIVAVILGFIIWGGDRTQKIETAISKELSVSPAETPVKPANVPSKDTTSLKTQTPPAPEKKAPVETIAGPITKATDLLTPADGAEFPRKDQIVFSWKMKSDTFTRFYILSAATGKIILWRGISPGTQEYTVAGNTLYPGKFVWYVGIKSQSRSFTVR